MIIKPPHTYLYLFIYLFIYKQPDQLKTKRIFFLDCYSFCTRAWPVEIKRKKLFNFLNFKSGDVQDGDFLLKVRFCTNTTTK